MNLSDGPGAILRGGWPPGPDAIFWVALVLVGGALAGELIARTTRVTRLVGYTGAGFAAAWAGMGVPTPMAGAPRLIVDIALALLLFEIGGRVHLRWLRFNPGLLATSLLETSLGAVAVFAALQWLGMDRREAVACAVLAVPASASVAGRVAHEIRAQGQVTNRVILLTALNTLYAVLLMTLLKPWLVTRNELDLPRLSETMGIILGGSLLVASLLAAAAAAVVRRGDLRDEGTALLMLGLVVLAVSAARGLGLSTLLVPLLAGLVLGNLSSRPLVWPRNFGTAGGMLVLMLFVIVGATGSPAILAAGGVGSLALVAARAIGKGVAAFALSRWSAASPRQGFALAVTLTPLSATALVMLADLHGAVGNLGAAVAPVIVTAVALLEFVGPLAVQWGLGLAGEVQRPGEDNQRDRQR